MNRERIVPRPIAVTTNTPKSMPPRRAKTVSESDEGGTSLTALCEPFFCDICTILKEGKVRKSNDALAVRSRLVARLDQLYAESNDGSASLADNYAQVEPILAFFADDVIMNAGLPYSDGWRLQMLLASHNRINNVAGAAHFFEYLESALRQPPAQASQILAIYLTCLGLGFAGIHRHNPQQLIDYSGQILKRLDANVVNVNAAEPICADLYHDDRKAKADIRDLFRPVREKVMVIGLVLSTLVICCLVSYLAIFLEARNQIKTTFGGITSHPAVTTRP